MRLFLFHERMIVNFCSANDDVHIVYYWSLVEIKRHGNYIPILTEFVLTPILSRNMTHCHVFSLLIYLL